MKKTVLGLTCVLLAVLMLAGCGSSAPSQAAPASTAPAPASVIPARSTPPAKSSELNVTFYNATDYNFHEIYITPTASNEWGADFLGSTNLLKKNGSIDVKVPAYDYENYDIQIVDEDDDVYLFTYVVLLEGTELYISWEEDGLYATVDHADGSSEMVQGEMPTGDTGGGEGTGAGAPAAAAPTGTGNDTNGAYSFTVYNESPYAIYAIYIGVTGASAAHDLDILPEILQAGSSIEVSGIASQGDWLNTEWTLFIEDVDGDVSQTFDVFNPWTVSYVDIYWDSTNGGYYCEFMY